MNSLTYLSHQFDVLASARTPPSTPTSEPPAFLADRYPSTSHQDGSLKRVKTWSTKLFLFPPPPSSSPGPKRSFSSPADFITLAAMRRSSVPSSLETPSRLPRSVDSVIRRIFFIRAFVLLWDALRAAWVSVTSAVVGVREPTIESDPEDEDKETEDEAKDDLPIRPLATPPPIPSLPVPRSLYYLRMGRSVTDTMAVEVKPETQTPSPSSLSPSNSITPPIISSRSPTPTLHARTTPFHLPKTLVLDLDETLIHSTSRPVLSSSNGGSGLLGLGSFGRRNKGAGHMVEVVLGGRSTLYHVYKRPFVDFFLRTVSGWYTVVIFTASMQEYADPVIDWLDAGRGILARRLFRDSCKQLPNGSYTKDLSIVEQDLSRVCLVDNSPISYRINEANGIPIEGWTHDPSDEALLDLLPVLDSLRFTSDVRRVLGIRGFS